MTANSAASGPSSGLAKAIWLNQQYTVLSTDCLLHQADWLAGKLSGNFRCTDNNNALKTGYDTSTQCWPEYLQKLGIRSQNLPRVVPPGTTINSITAAAAAATGLAKTAVIVAGTTDSTAAVIATGANQPGDAITSLGSTLVLKIISEQPIFNTEYGVYSQPYGEFWLAGGASNAGGAVLRQYFTDDQMTDMQQSLDFSQPTELSYYPLNGPGERFPINDATLKPCLTPRPDDDVVFFQAILEAITDIECRGYQLLYDLGAAKPQTLFSCGGGSENRKWRKKRAETLNIPISQPKNTEAAYGAALLAVRSVKSGMNHRN